MANVLEVKSLEFGNIFQNDFKDLRKDNVISFESAKRMAVLYAPNGVGKTTFADTLKGEEGRKYIVSYNETEYQTGNGALFHVISDQNSRVIIEGETRAFLLGDDVSKEYDLKEQIDRKYKECKDEMIASLKEAFGLSKKKQELHELVNDHELRNLISNLTNSGSSGKGRDYTFDAYLDVVFNLDSYEIESLDNEKFHYFIEQYDNPESIIHKFMSIPSEKLRRHPRIHEIGENTDALSILNKYIERDDCVVCDNEGIDAKQLIANKAINRQDVLESLGESIKEPVEALIALDEMADIFHIKATIMQALQSGDFGLVGTLQNEIKRYMKAYGVRVQVLFLTNKNNIKLKELVQEYNQLRGDKIEITDEDLAFIKTIARDYIGKELSIERDNDKNIRIVLDGDELLGTERTRLQLSNGEQNYLSLSFEFLKAKNSDAQIVVIDDPISSFDSIYKSKVVYEIMEVLKEKDIIVLTHNIEVVRLLDSQYKKSFKLYILNNDEQSRNGFIEVPANEIELFLYLDKLPALFRDPSFGKEILNRSLFLVAIAPFMRGFASIIGNYSVMKTVQKIMHGYESEEVDLASCFENLFNNSVDSCYMMSANSIIELDITDDIVIVNEQQYYFLNRALVHSAKYLQLRLLVEKTLVEKYLSNGKHGDQLGEIIRQAYPDVTDPDQKSKRIKLMSKKTLLNEFNHFEGNLSIFQPAIDISDAILLHEVIDIKEFCSIEAVDRALVDSIILNVEE